MTKNIQDHLKKIEDDQLLNGINSIENTRRDDLGRHHAVSQMNQPVLVLGYYNKASGRYELGDWQQSMTPNSAYTTASAAALTLTCAAGHRYKVYAAGNMNATAASAGVMSGNIGGNAISSLGTSSSTTAMSFYFSAAGTTALFGSPSPIWMNAGDTLTLTLQTYAGGNDTEHFILFEDYEV